MDAHDPQLDTPAPAPRSRFARVRSLLALPARLLSKPLAMIADRLPRFRKPSKADASRAVDKAIRVPGAGLMWMFIRRQLVFGTALLLLVLSVPLIMREMVIRSIPPPPPPPTAEDVWQAVERRDWNAVKRLAGQLHDDENLTDENQGVPAYALGLAALSEADQYEGRAQAAFYALAAKNFAEAQARGFPADHEVEGLYLLGKSLFHSRQWDEAREPLEEALQHAPDELADTQRMLTEIYHHGSKPNLKQALEHANAFCDVPKLTAPERNEGWLRKARILFDLLDSPGCRAALEKIPSDARVMPEVHALRGRLLMREANEAVADGSPAGMTAMKELYQKAIDALRLSLGRGNGETPASRQALYLMGVCLREGGDPRAAVEQFGRVFRQFPETDEGLAAGYAQAELLARLGNVDESLVCYDRLIRLVGNPEKFHNEWFTVEELTNRLLNVETTFLTAKDFDRAIRLAEMLPPLIPADRATQIAAQAYRAWAANLQHEAESGSPAQVDEQRRAAREKLRQAGRKYAELAELRLTTRSYPDDLWESVQSSVAGRDYERAIKIIHRYLEVEERRRRPLALLTLGECHLALGRPNEALAALRECLAAHPNDPAAYRARLLGAKALTRLLDQTPEAETEKSTQYATEAAHLLKQNLSGEALTPASLEYRDSLFEFGKFMYERGVEAELAGLRLRNGLRATNAEGKESPALTRMENYFAEARQYFNEAVTALETAVDRYPNAEQAVEARYLMAETYRLALRSPREQLAQETLDSQRVKLTEQIQFMTDMATNEYKLVQDALNKRQEHAELTPMEQAVLRNAYFFHGSVLVDAGRYQDAINVYSTAQDRYQDQPEVLLAFFQIIHCNWKLGRMDEYNGAIAQALSVLDKTSKDDKKNEMFLKATNRTWDQWHEDLTWLYQRNMPDDKRTLQTARTP